MRNGSSVLQIQPFAKITRSMRAYRIRSNGPTYCISLLHCAQ